MSQIEAIYQSGCFKPEGDVGLPENQRVRLHVEPIGPNDPGAAMAWLERVKEHHRQILERRGGVPFPDSAPEIAEDRMRDV